MTKSMKKLFALMLVLTMAIMPIKVNAATTANLEDLTNELYNFSYEDELVDLIETIDSIDNKDAFVSAFTTAFGELNEVDQQTLAQLKVTTDAVAAIVEFVENEPFSVEKVVELIESTDPVARDEFISLMENHRDNIEDLFTAVGATSEDLEKGFNHLDSMYASYEKAKEMHFKFFVYNTSTSTLYVDESDIKQMIVYFNSLMNEQNIDIQIANANEAIDALEVFVAYFNNTDQADDKVAVKSYLSGLGILRTTSNGSSSGGSTGGTTSPSTDLGDITGDITSGDLSDEDAAEKVNDVMDKVTDKLDDVTSENGAFSALNTVSDVLESTDDVIEALESEEAVAAVVEQVEDTLASTMNALDYISNANTAALKAKAIIADVAKIAMAVDNDAQSAGLATAALGLAELAVEKSGTVAVASNTVKVDDGVAKADLRDVDFKATLTKVSKAASDMNKALTENGIDANRDLAVGLTLNVLTEEDSVAVELPDLADAFAVVDFVSVATDVATFNIGEGTFEGTADIQLSANTVAADTLTADQKAALPEGVENVIDFNAMVAGEKVSSFAGTMVVEVPYTLEEGQDPEKVSFYLLTDAGEVEKVAGKFNPATGKIIVERNHFSMYYANVSNDTFADLTSVEWARQAVEVLAGKGIIAGKGEGKFDPTAKITRAEFVALISRMLQLEADGTELPFEDVDMAKWYAKDIAAAYQNGIISGKSANAFAPNATITRQEAAKVIANALACVGVEGEATGLLVKGEFGDYSNIASWAKPSVATAFREGIINGKPGQVFDPAGDTTRAEVAMMVYKLYFLY